MTNDIFNPEMLQLARESRGMTQSALAKKAGLTQGFVSRAENGDKEPSTEKLEAMSRALAYPIRFFFQQGRVAGLGISLVYYRKRSRTLVGDLRRLQAEVNLRRLAVAQLLDGVELESHNTFQLMDIDDHDGDVEGVAALVRASWQLPLGPVKNLIGAIESAGGLVFMFPFGTKDIDAISVWPDDMPPLFFANAQAPTDRMRFSLAHELGHVIMHSNATEDMEREADRFASEFLMPQREVGPRLSGMSIKRAAQLKPYWRVSMAALIKRSRDLGRIDQDTYSKLFRRLSSLGYRKSEPVSIPPERPRLVDEIVRAYQESHGYTVEEMARLASWNIDDYSSRFLDQEHHLRIAR